MSSTVIAEQRPILEGETGNWNRCVEPRLGIMFHFDDSSGDPGAVEWLKRDPLCHVSYNGLILDDGSLVEVAPWEARAWHAGACRSSDPARLAYRDANSAFYGLAFAAKAGDRITAVQRDVAVEFAALLFRENGWGATETWRITDHATEAWPRGRKVDIGTLLKGVTLEDLRTRVSTRVRNLVPAP